MSSNRVKIDVNDNDGNKIIISLEGRLTRDNVLKLLDIVDLLGRSPDVHSENKELTLSKFEKIQKIILQKYPLGWFTSQDIMESYEDSLDEPIGLSTVSTYLTRLTMKGVLTKTGPTSKRKYKVINLIKKDDQPKYKISP